MVHLGTYLTTRENLMTKFNSLKSAALITTFLCATHISFAEAKSNKTADFISKASTSNMFEIESSKLATSKSQNEDIKKFAQDMINDHGNVGSELESAVKTSGQDSILIKKSLDSKHQKKLDKLKSSSGKDFDKEYVDDQNDAHKDGVKLFKDYSEKGEDATLKDFAAKTLPTLEQHQQRIKEIKDAM
jgi:putative membrane protein